MSVRIGMSVWVCTKNKRASCAHLYKKKVSCPYERGETDKHLAESDGQTDKRSNARTVDRLSLQRNSEGESRAQKRTSNPKTLEVETKNEEEGRKRRRGGGWVRFSRVPGTEISAFTLSLGFRRQSLPQDIILSVLCVLRWLKSQKKIILYSKPS